MESVTSVAVRSTSLPGKSAPLESAPIAPGTDGASFPSPGLQNPDPGIEDAAVVTLSGQRPDRTEEQNSEEASRKAEQQEIRRLQERDREVKAHEQAHLGALGAYKSGGASYTYETGPDGRQYAVGGEVPVDVSTERTPEETIRKAQTIRRAALAPAEPSGADRAVAAQAAQLEAQARAEIAKETQSRKESGENSDAERSADKSTQRGTEEEAPTGTTTPAASAKLSAYRRVPTTTSSKADTYA